MNFPYLLSLFTFSSLTSGDDTLAGSTGAEIVDGLAGNDSLNGLGGNDVLAGGAGNDSLSGGEGDDLLIGDAGNDTLDGGAGFDLVSYENATAAIRVDLSDTVARDTGGAGRDLLRGIEGVIGSLYADRLQGNAGANLLVGGADNDSLRGGTGDDTLLGGLGDDVLNGERGRDTADYSDIDAGVTVTLMTTALQNTGAGGLDVLLGIENLTGGAGDDMLTGSKADNRLTGGAGDDTLAGEAGADTLVGGLGDDVYQVDSALDVVTEAEGEGTDTVVAQLSHTLGAQVENLTLAENAAALNGTGNALANVLVGNGLDNLLAGGGGDDTLTGGLGNDTLSGGAGSDTATYADATAGLVLSLAQAAGQAVGVLGTDVLISIENLIGGAGHDRLSGDEAANRLEGGAGRDSLAGGAGKDTLEGGLDDDSLEGGLGNDLLQGGAGNDTLAGGAGDNTLVGGDGLDVVRYAQSLDDVSVIWQPGSDSYLVVTASARDLVSGVESFVFGTTTFAASFLQATRLTSGADTATAAAVGETIYGLGGHDSLTGGAGNDLLWGGTGHDTLTGGAGNDLLMGEEGNDQLYAGLGSDSVNGGAGQDTLYLPDRFAQLVITYANGTYTFTGPSGVVIATEIEALYCGTDLLTNRLPARLAIASAEPRVLEGTDGSREISFTVTLDRAVLSDVTVDFAVSAVTPDLTAEDFAEGVLPSGTVTLAAGETSATFSLWIAPDSVYEAAESFAVTLSNPSAGVFLVQPAVAITLEDDDIRFLTMGEETVSGTPGADRIDGLGGDDSLSGLEGNDILWGGADRDTLYGGAGDDTLYGGAGSDRLYGDAGIDTVSYATLTGGVNASLKTGYARSLIEGSDRLEGVENLTGGAGDDTLIGAEGANLLIGNAGNDSLDGGAGDDTLVGGTGDDIYEIDSLADVVTEREGEGTDTIITSISLTLAGQVENLQLTGAGAISGTGNWLNNRLTGNLRANTLTGGGGRDTLTGGQGNDTLIGGGGVDWFIVDGGLDRVEDLGTGEVLVVNASAAASVTLVSDFTATSATVLNGRTTMVLADGVSANLAQATGTRGVSLSAAANATATVLTGTQRADTLIGGAGADALTGGAEDDLLTGGAGNDTLTGGNGADTFTIDAGSDQVTDLGGADVLNVAATASVQAVVRANYAATTASVIRGTTEITLANGRTADLSAAQGARGVTLSAEGNSLGSFMTGTGRADTLLGGEGNDTLNGGAGNDAIQGGVGNDILVGAVEDGLLDGGEGDDTLLTTASLAALSDAQIIDIEQVFLMLDNLKADFSTQTEAFRFQGYDSGASSIIGGMGNDTVIGGTGNDTLAGGKGDDRLEGGAGANSLSGGEGADTLVGFQSDVLLEGGAGNDVLLVGATFTSVSDGQIQGIESMTLTATGIRLDLSGQTEDLVMTGFATGASTLIGGSGDDVLSGGSGNDSLVGGAGIDTLSYAGAGAAVSVTLVLGLQDTGGAGTDRFSGFEGLVGSAFDDRLTGDGGGNILSGGLGKDTLSGADGDDLIEGGADNDSLSGGAGADTLIADAADDLIDGGADADALRLLSDFVAAADAQIVGIETVVLGVGGLTVDLGNQTEDLTLIGHASAASAIEAGQGNDSLAGGAGNDTLDGGLGADSLAGGAGADSLTGGAGADVFVFNATPGEANADTITDLDPGTDLIWLSRAAMAGLGALGALDPAAFLAQTNPRFSGDLGADHRVLYDPTTGDLFYDADGNGAVAAVRLADIGIGLELSAYRFQVID